MLRGFQSLSLFPTLLFWNNQRQRAWWFFYQPQQGSRRNLVCDKDLRRVPQCSHLLEIISSLLKTRY